MQPGQPAPAAVQPLQWQIGQGMAANGHRLCALALTQGALSVSVQLSPDDMERLAKDLLKIAGQAKSGLILPNGSGG